MREILFRGKSSENGEWIYGSLIKRSIGSFIVDEANKCSLQCCGEFDFSFNSKLVKSETIGQYTGLTKNGNKIFEGDVFAWNDNEIDEITGKPYPDEISVVCFDDEKSAFVSKTLNGTCEGLYETISDKNSRYIGNIHDNPELLKGGENG